MLRDEATVADIVKAARLALMFKGELDSDEFLQDLKTQAAVLHELQIVGEAVKRLSVSFRDARPEIPWKAIAGMRDKLIHGYDSVDLEEVWKTLNVDVPHLLAYLRPLLPPGSAP